MPGQIWAVPGTNTLYAMLQATLFDEDRSLLWDRRYPNGFRGPATDRISAWTQEGGRWPSRSGFFASPGGLGPSTNQMFDQEYEPWKIGYGSARKYKYIFGQCKDYLDDPVSGAIVRGFLTATDQFVRQTTADVDGFFELPTEFPDQDHYCVAYRAGSPDFAGTSVNTLRGVNRDGT